MHDGLLLGEKLRRRGMDVDSFCSLCHMEQEVPSHLFRDCVMIANFWRSSVLAPFWPSSSSGSFANWCACFVRNLSRASSYKHLLDTFVSSLWAIWIVRNDMRFRYAPWDPGALLVISQGWMDRCSAVWELHHRCHAQSSVHTLSLVSSAMSHPHSSFLNWV